MPEITLTEVSLDNLRDVVNLKVADQQTGFVAGNARSRRDVENSPQTPDS